MRTGFKRFGGLAALVGLLVTSSAWGAPDAPIPWSETAQRTWAAAYASLNRHDVREFPWANDRGASSQGESCEAVLYYASNSAAAYIQDTELCLRVAAGRGAASAATLVYGGRETAAERQERLYVSDPAPLPPIVSEIASVTQRGFTLPIVDGRNLPGTEYRVTVALAQQDAPRSNPRAGLMLHPGERVISSSVGESKCRTFSDLQPGSTYKFEVVAISPSGAESSPVTWKFGGNPSSVTHIPLQTRTGPAGSWERDRMASAAAVYGVTPRARQWMLSDVYVQGFRNEPGYAGYLGPDFVGVGYTSPGMTHMHEMMHAFWSHWDFPRGCDEANLVSFRFDLIQFLLEFRRYERAGGANPLEDWRTFYDRWVRHSMGYFEDYQRLNGESLWNVFANGNFSELWTGGFWSALLHGAETQIPHLVAGKSALIPPSLRPYFDGFIANNLAGYAIVRADGSRCDNPQIGDNSFTWADEMYCYTSLPDEDRYLWNTAYDIAHIRHSSPAEYTAPDSAPRSRIPEPLRTRLRNADRQRLVDFVNTFGELHETNDGRGALWDKDSGFWGAHTRNFLIRSQFYLDELSSGIGVELSEANLDAVKDVLSELIGGLSCARNEYLSQNPGAHVDDDILRTFIEEPGGTIDTLVSFVNAKSGISALQRTAFLEMIDIYPKEGHFICHDWASRV